MSEYIGARISLISKSDIRYCGTLHEINSEKATVALENVYSYGTEGRRGDPTEEIAPSDTPYEYIVFRGSDVKDLRIEEGTKENKPPQPPVPNDPAILGTGSRPQSQNPPGASFPNQRPPQHFQHPYGQYPPFPGQQYGPPGGFPGGPRGPGGPGGFPGYPGMPYGAPPGWYPPPGQGFPQPGPFSPPQMPIGHPQPPQEKPAQEKPMQEVDAGSTPAGDGSAVSKTATPVSAANQTGPPPPVETKPDVAAALAPAPPVTAPVTAAAAPSAAPTTAAPATAAPAPKPTPTGPKSTRIVPAVPITRKAAAQPGPPVGNASNATTQVAPNAAAQYQDATQAATAAVAAAMAKLQQPGKSGPPSKPSTATEADPMDNLTKKVADMRAADPANNTRGTGQRGGYANSHPRGGRGGRRGGGQHHGPSAKVEVPTTDYDFESANAKFNKQDLVKEAIASGTPLGENDAAHGANGTAKSPDGTAEPATAATAAHPASGKDDVVIPPPATSYNKSTSFFDNISSELRDREDAAARRVAGGEFRTEERRKNVETFGQGSVDGFRGNYRGGYRGRRGYRGRGGGGGYRGRGGPRRGGTEAGLA